MTRGLMLLGVLGVLMALPAAAQVQPRTSVSVDREMVLLGDIFSGLPAGARADAEVMRAPAPGQRFGLDATTLAAVAQSHGLRWAPTSRTERVNIERASASLGVDRFRPAIGRALVDRGLPAGADFTFDNEALRVMVPSGADPLITVDQMQYDGRARFVATVIVGDDLATAERLRLTGKVFQTVEAAVFARAIQPGEAIRLRDVQMVRVRVDQAGAATVTDPSRMVGRTVRRAIAAGQPVRTQDLAPINWVQRNGLVTVKVDSDRIVIAMQGKALDDGAEGDMVRVMNTRSDKMIRGMVTGPGEVTVKSAYALAAK